MGCSGAMLMKVTPNSVSCRVVNMVNFPPESATVKSTSTPTDFPIQLRCMVRTRSGHPVSLSQEERSSPAYSVILKNHCSSSLCVTTVLHRQHRPLSTCSLASTVWHDGHQLT